ncbi:hypothetical protein BDM02DRAFT_3109288 [Thelephora ganbajun]|uniref:Uncharacterized protein n=1 Tax=Thelephora ganbajun TaxID=370292 RepID=A0ACB6ZS22_THEGA|nr:hypothetical protein BDM02DRAFT_3109288 [Thelephora ganbajun]
MPTRFSLLFLIAAGSVVAGQGPFTSSLVYDPNHSTSISTKFTTIRTTVIVTLTGLSFFPRGKGAYTHLIFSIQLSRLQQP